MAKFITNIELLDADEKDYDSLYKELEKESFKGEEHGAKSVAYVTEKKTFSVQGNLTIQEVNEAVFRAASKTGKKYSFFVIKNKSVSNANLQ